MRAAAMALTAKRNENSSVKNLHETVNQRVPAAVTQGLPVKGRIHSPSPLINQGIPKMNKVLAILIVGLFAIGAHAQTAAPAKAAASVPAAAAAAAPAKAAAPAAAAKPDAKADAAKMKEEKAAATKAKAEEKKAAAAKMKEEKAAAKKAKMEAKPVAKKEEPKK